MGEEQKGRIRVREKEMNEVPVTDNLEETSSDRAASSRTRSILTSPR